MREFVLDNLEYFQEEYNKITDTVNSITSVLEHAKGLAPKLTELTEMIASVPTSLKYEDPETTKFDILIESLQAVLHDLSVFTEDLSEFSGLFNSASDSVNKLKEY